MEYWSCDARNNNVHGIISQQLRIGNIDDGTIDDDWV